MKRLAIVGGGAAGSFCAARLAHIGGLAITVVESGSSPMKKLLKTGGGRCNFTNFSIDALPPKNFYPRGASKLRKALKNFGAKETAEYFRELGVEWREENNSRVFPASGRAESIVNAIRRAAQNAEFKVGALAGELRKGDDGLFALTAICEGKKVEFEADFVLIACGGIWAKSLKHSLLEMGHSFLPPAPSLFSMDFQAGEKWKLLAGISLDDVALSMRVPSDAEQPGSKEQCAASRGAFLFTHTGASGPAVLDLSARAARMLQESGYRAEISANFLPSYSAEKLMAGISLARQKDAKCKIKNAPAFPIASKIWEVLILDAAGVNPDETWANVSRQSALKLVECVSNFKLLCTSRNSSKAEFVTCGGLNTDEVDFSSMESKIVSNLFFAGECLDIDAISGGFNLQAAWTTAKICADTISGRMLS